MPGRGRAGRRVARRDAVRGRPGGHDDGDDDDGAAAPTDDDHDDDDHDHDATPTVPRPTTIAAGVTVGGELLVGGLSPAAATAAIKAFFARPVTLQLGKVSLRATPKQLGASAYVGDAVKRARIVRPGANVPLKVAAPLPRIERYVAGLARRFDRAPVESELSLRNGKPFVTKEQIGRRLRQVDRRARRLPAASRRTTARRSRCAPTRWCRRRRARRSAT